MDTNQVIVRQDKKIRDNCIIILVHPFYVKGVFLSRLSSQEKISNWQFELAEKINKLPGVQNINLTNGEICIIHNGLFSDEEIYCEAKKIIEPYLKTNLLLMDIE